MYFPFENTKMQKYYYRQFQRECNGKRIVTLAIYTNEELENTLSNSKYNHYGFIS